MNILIPYSWLTEHLDTNASAEEIQWALSLSGPSVERIYNREGESVFDIEVTTNRVDTYSVRGIAREAAAILPQFGFNAQLKPLGERVNSQISDSSMLPIIHNDDRLNRRILMTLLRDVRHEPTPDWMARRLRQIEINVHDSVIDITNYVTHELGFACHAFDYDKLMSLGGEIFVKTADQGMTFTTLSGENFTCVGGEVVFTNQAGEIIDLPGIKGTLNSAVDDNTQNVLFFLESIQPEKIRFASMTHAIRTQAAQINEKSVDPHLALDVLHRGLTLYQDLTGARLDSQIYDDFPGRTEVVKISLTLDTVKAYLGIDLPASQIAELLTRLGATVEEDGSSLLVQPPTFRPDLKIEADLVEEIARLYGYHNLPSQLMTTPIPTQYPANINIALEEQVQQLLADLGYQELYTYSLVSESLARQSDPGLNRTLALRNPLTSDMTHLRLNILPSHLDLMSKQIGQAQLKGTFELANVYPSTDGNLPDEHLQLAIMDKDIRSLRATVETLFSRLYIKNTQVTLTKENTNIAEYRNTFYLSSAIITVNGEVLGTLGYLEAGLCGAQLEWRQILKWAKAHPDYQSIPTTSPYYEDITLEIESGSPVGEVVAAIMSGSPLIRQANLIDRFENRWTFRLQYWDYKEQIDAATAMAIRESALSAALRLGARLAV